MQSECRKRDEKKDKNTHVKNLHLILLLSPDFYHRDLWEAECAASPDRDAPYKEGHYGRSSRRPPHRLPPPSVEITPFFVPYAPQTTLSPVPVDRTSTEAPR